MGRRCGQAQTQRVGRLPAKCVSTRGVAVRPDTSLSSTLRQRQPALLWVAADTSGPTAVEAAAAIVAAMGRRRTPRASAYYTMQSAGVWGAAGVGASSSICISTWQSQTLLQQQCMHPKPQRRSSSPCGSRARLARPGTTANFHPRCLPAHCAATPPTSCRPCSPPSPPAGVCGPEAWPAAGCGGRQPEQRQEQRAGGAGAFHCTRRGSCVRPLCPSVLRCPAWPAATCRQHHHLTSSSASPALNYPPHHNPAPP